MVIKGTIKTKIQTFYNRKITDKRKRRNKVNTFLKNYKMKTIGQN